MRPSICSRCFGAAAKSSLRPHYRSISSSRPCLNESDSASRSVRERAWYLPSPKPTSLSTPTSTSTNGSTSTPTNGTSGRTAQPRFTTFDPSRTTSSISSTAILPLPSNAPEELEPLHHFLTSHEDALAVLDPSSVMFLHTPSSGSMRRERELVETGQIGDNVGAYADWVVVVTVNGVGNNVIGRAERALRVWLHNNPIGEEPRQIPERPKTPRTQEGTDWSVISLPEKSIAINLFTAEGRERWNLEDLWGRSSPKTAFAGWPKEDKYTGFGW